MKKSISQIILCSFYLKVKAASYKHAAPGQPPIHKPAIVFPSKKFLCISAIKIFHRVKYSLARFWPRRNFFLASTGLNGPNRLPRGLPHTWPRGPPMLSPGQAVGVLPQPGSPALAGISWVSPDLLPALPFPWGSGPFAGPISGSTSLHRPKLVALQEGPAVGEGPARPMSWPPGPLVTPREQLPLQLPDSERWTGLLGCPGRVSHGAGPGREGLLVPARPWHFTEQY